MIEYNGETFGESKLMCSAPVWEPCFEESCTYPNGDKLPALMITEPVRDADGNLLGRTYTMRYPVPSFYDEYYPGTDPSDADGSIALHYGARYYDEGMSYTDPEDRRTRIECFRAAEVLYRHAAGRGNNIAHLNLGYVYSYDRCEGYQWADPRTLNSDEDYVRPYPREKRAFESLEIAAKAGICEACYKFGDMHRRGMGCEPNAEQAFRWYVRASELSEREHPVTLGSVALRLGTCYEEGLGCRQDFARAAEWYRQATEGLEIAVEHGETWYEKALADAKAGLKRCLQEL